jgi:hypothetical protein
VHDRVWHCVALYGKWSTLTGARKSTEDRAKMLASTAIAKVADKTAKH